jgi:hypothetical protein
VSVNTLSGGSGKEKIQQNICDSIGGGSLCTSLHVGYASRKRIHQSMACRNLSDEPVMSWNIVRMARIESDDFLETTSRSQDLRG